MRLHVQLGDIEVGTLEQRPDRGMELRFSDSYVADPRRPSLSLFYVDKLGTSALAPASALPPFFTNLLPETGGALRRLIAAAAGAREDQDLKLLAHLGGDLPGAVRVRVKEGHLEDADPPPASSSTTERPGALRFSLAGVQLKFSVLRDGKQLVLPASGQGGDWIVKLPDMQYDGVPENEYAVMSWARASGIEVPDFELVGYDDLAGIPDQRFFARESLCFAIRRFDRPSADHRVHIEDFAQAFGYPPGWKYFDDQPEEHRLNYESLARLVQLYCPPEDLRAFVRRLVFVVLSGNADAHLKNWSLIYPDTRRPRLSPAYDLVATIAYPGTDERLALPFAGSQAFERVSFDGFRRLAPKLGLDPDELASWAAEDVFAVMGAWSAVQREGVPISLELRMSLNMHHQRLAREPGSLLHGRG